MEMPREPNSSRSDDMSRSPSNINREEMLISRSRPRTPSTEKISASEDSDSRSSNSQNYSDAQADDDDDDDDRYYNDSECDDDDEDTDFDDHYDYVTGVFKIPNEDVKDDVKPDENKDDEMVTEDSDVRPNDGNLLLWAEEFKKLSVNLIVKPTANGLDELMKFYIEKVSYDVHGGYKKISTAVKLKKHLSEALFFFYLNYMNSQMVENLCYLNKMSILLAFYFDMEIKASRRAKENVNRIAGRLVSCFYIFLGNSMDHILDAILGATLIVRGNEDVCIPVIRKVLDDINKVDSIFCIKQYNSVLTYTRYILVFKMWKRLVQGADQRRIINKKAVDKLEPAPSNLRETIKKGILNGIFPIIPKSRKNVTQFVVQAKFNAREKAKVFLRVTRSSSQYELPESDRKSFFSDDNVFIDNSLKIENIRVTDNWLDKCEMSQILNLHNNSTLSVLSLIDEIYTDILKASESVAERSKRGSVAHIRNSRKKELLSDAEKSSSNKHGYQKYYVRNYYSKSGFRKSKTIEPYKDRRKRVNLHSKSQYRNSSGSTLYNKLDDKELSDKLVVRNIRCENSATVDRIRRPDCIDRSLDKNTVICVNHYDKAASSNQMTVLSSVGIKPNVIPPTSTTDLATMNDVAISMMDITESTLSNIKSEPDSEGESQANCSSDVTNGEHDNSLKTVVNRPCTIVPAIPSSLTLKTEIMLPDEDLELARRLNNTSISVKETTDELSSAGVNSFSSIKNKESASSSAQSSMEADSDNNDAPNEARGNNLVTLSRGRNICDSNGLLSEINAFYRSQKNTSNNRISCETNLPSTVNMNNPNDLVHQNFLLCSNNAGVGVCTNPQCNICNKKIIINNHYIPATGNKGVIMKYISSSKTCANLCTNTQNNHSAYGLSTSRQQFNDKNNYNNSAVTTSASTQSPKLNSNVSDLEVPSLERSDISGFTLSASAFNTNFSNFSNQKLNKNETLSLSKVNTILPNGVVKLIHQEHIFGDVNSLINIDSTTKRQSDKPNNIQAAMSECYCPPDNKVCNKRPKSSSQTCPSTSRVLLNPGSSNNECFLNRAEDISCEGCDNEHKSSSQTILLSPTVLTQKSSKNEEQVLFNRVKDDNRNACGQVPESSLQTFISTSPALLNQGSFNNGEQFLLNKAEDINCKVSVQESESSSQNFLSISPTLLNQENLNNEKQFLNKAKNINYEVYGQEPESSSQTFLATSPTLLNQESSNNEKQFLNKSEDTNREVYDEPQNSSQTTLMTSPTLLNQEGSNNEEQFFLNKTEDTNSEVCDQERDGDSQTILLTSPTLLNQESSNNETQFLNKTEDTNCKVCDHEPETNSQTILSTSPTLLNQESSNNEEQFFLNKTEDTNSEVCDQEHESNSQTFLSTSPTLLNQESFNNEEQFLLKAEDINCKVSVQEPYSGSKTFFSTSPALLNQGSFNNKKQLFLNKAEDLDCKISVQESESSSQTFLSTSPTRLNQMSSNNEKRFLNKSEDINREVYDNEPENSSQTFLLTSEVLLNQECSNNEEQFFLNKAENDNCVTCDQEPESSSQTLLSTSPTPLNQESSNNEKHFLDKEEESDDIQSHPITDRRAKKKKNYCELDQNKRPNSNKKSVTIVSSNKRKNTSTSTKTTSKRLKRSDKDEKPLECPTDKCSSDYNISDEKLNKDCDSERKVPIIKIVRAKSPDMKDRSNKNALSNETPKSWWVESKDWQEDKEWCTKRRSRTTSHEHPEINKVRTSVTIQKSYPDYTDQTIQTSSKISTSDRVYNQVPATRAVVRKKSKQNELNSENLTIEDKRHVQDKNELGTYLDGSKKITSNNLRYDKSVHDQKSVFVTRNLFHMSSVCKKPESPKQSTSNNYTNSPPQSDKNLNTNSASVVLQQKVVKENSIHVRQRIGERFSRFQIPDVDEDSISDNEDKETYYKDANRFIDFDKTCKTLSATYIDDSNKSEGDKQLAHSCNKGLTLLKRMEANCKDLKQCKNNKLENETQGSRKHSRNLVNQDVKSVKIGNTDFVNADISCRSACNTPELDCSLPLKKRRMISNLVVDHRDTSSFCQTQYKFPVTPDLSAIESKEPQLMSIQEHHHYSIKSSYRSNEGNLSYDGNRSYCSVNTQNNDMFSDSFNSRGEKSKYQAEIQMSPDFGPQDATPKNTTNINKFNSDRLNEEVSPEMLAAAVELVKMQSRALGKIETKTNTDIVPLLSPTVSPEEEYPMNLSPPRKNLTRKKPNKRVTRNRRSYRKRTRR